MMPNIRYVHLHYYKDGKKESIMRVFVAAEVSDSTVIESISRFQSQININARPTKPQNLHFTFQFLGEIQEDMVEKIMRALESIVFTSFMVDFEGVGVFPKIQSPRVIWIGTKPEKELERLAEKVNDALVSLGFPSKGTFHPHVTIFRIKRAVNIRDIIERHASTKFGRQRISSIKLKQSILGSDGPKYSDLGVVAAS